MIPTSTATTITTKTEVSADADAIVAFITQGDKSAGAELVALIGDLAAKSIDRLLAAKVAHGKAKEIVFDLMESGAKLKRVYVAGLGKADKVSAESIRIASGGIAKALRKHRIGKATVAVPAVGGISAESAAEAVTTGLLLASFDYEEYKGSLSKKKSGGDDDKQKPLAVTLLAPENQMAAVKAAVDQAKAICDGQNFARTIASRPGNDINPSALAEVARDMAREVGLDFRVLDEKQMAKLGMGGILAVGAGSIGSPPRMIVLEHKAALSKKGTKPAAPLLVVGKAITFDTGGISIKPADKMGKMIFDKCGGMAVLGLMYAVARLHLSVHVVGILSSAENAISSKAYRPGDILRMYNGITVEVTNTDAEGRLVLADALAWGIETYKPRAVIDLATLTGGVIVALGKTMAGVMGNDDGLITELNKAAEEAGEKIWRLPLGDDQRDHIKSDHADIVNSAGREGHPLQGGAFLSHFVPEDPPLPWAHLDIAGVGDTEKDLPYYTKGATGWGVRTLVNWVAAKR